MEIGSRITVRTPPWVLSLVLCSACGGYDAADSDDLEPRAGEVVGVLIDERDKAHPDAWIQLLAADGTEVLQEYQGMDSDGRFGVFPPATGTYNIIGSFGEPATSTNKAIKQSIAFTAGSGMNIGKVRGDKVAVLTAHVATPDGIDPEGVTIEVLGTDASTTTVAEGVGAIPTGIPAGTYSVRFSKDGLETVVVDDVTLVAAEAKVLDDIVMTAAK